MSDLHNEFIKNVNALLNVPSTLAVIQCGYKEGSAIEEEIQKARERLRSVGMAWVRDISSRYMTAKENGRVNRIGPKQKEQFYKDVTSSVNSALRVLNKVDKEGKVPGLKDSINDLKSVKKMLVIYLDEHAKIINGLLKDERGQTVLTAAFADILEEAGV